MGKLCEKLLFRPKKRSSVSCIDASLRYEIVHSSAKRSLKLESAHQPAAIAAILILPLEISEMIFDLLDLVSMIRLRQTCRTLYLHQGPTLADLFQELSCRYDPSTDFARCCFAERSSTKRLGLPGTRLCGGCKIYHPIRSFSTENIAKQPEERLCIGQHGRLYFTPEHSISFMELTALMHTPRYMRHFLTDMKRKTTHGHRSTIAVDRHTPHLISPLYQHHIYGYGHVFSYFWVLNVQSLTNRIDSKVPLKKQLSGKAIDLCPHVTSNDTQAISAVHECLSKGIYTHKVRSLPSLSYHILGVPRVLNMS